MICILATQTSHTNNLTPSVAAVFAAVNNSNQVFLHFYLLYIIYLMIQASPPPAKTTATPTCKTVPPLLGNFPTPLQTMLAGPGMSQPPHRQGWGTSYYPQHNFPPMAAGIHPSVVSHDPW